MYPSFRRFFQPLSSLPLFPPFGRHSSSLSLQSAPKIAQDNDRPDQRKEGNDDANDGKDGQ